MEIKNSYNGWSAEVRAKRGTSFYAALKAGQIPRKNVCSICGSTKGVTFHAEEYGSTWADYIKSCHELCCYCHGFIHMRNRLPNRWKRFLHNAAIGTLPDFPFTSLQAVFQAAKNMRDLPAYDLPSDLPFHWTQDLVMGPYVGEHYKVALLKTPHGHLIPDPKIYGTNLENLQGLRYDAGTQELVPYLWERAPGLF